MAYERMHRCDRIGCGVTQPPEAFAQTSGYSVAYEGLPRGWVRIQESEHGRKNTFCGLDCASGWIHQEIERERR
jgi:hypothetical protein